MQRASLLREDATKAKLSNPEKDSGRAAQLSTGWERASTVAKALADGEDLETCVSAKRTGFIFDGKVHLSFRVARGCAIRNEENESGSFGGKTRTYTDGHEPTLTSKDQKWTMWTRWMDVDKQWTAEGDARRQSAVTTRERRVPPIRFCETNPPFFGRIFIASDYE
jgi:hypothetical protein